MKFIRLFLATLISTALYGASPAGNPAVAKTEPWIGTWDLNLAKSRLNPANAARSDTRIFSVAPDGEKATWRNVDPQGKSSHTASTYKFDGKDYPITGGATRETVSFTRVDSHTLAFVGKENGKVVRTGTRAVSKDGKVLTVTVKGTDGDGKATEDLWVLDRRTATSAADVLKNALQFHDPHDKWREFSGQVRLVTNVGAGGANIGEEIVELRNAEGYYKRTTTLRGEPTVQGVERGVPFWSASRDAKAADTAAKKKRPSDDSIKGLQHHQIAHVGFVMAIAASGLQLGPSAELTEFNGLPVHALTFSRTPRVVHPYWDSDFVVYIDRDTFALRGYKIMSGPNAGRTVVVLGDLDIAGIQVPRAKIYYAGNGAYQFTDIFTRP